MKNSIILIGNCGKQPEIRNFNSGGRVASFSLATTESWKKDGERKSLTQWHSVQVFDEYSIKLIEKHLNKGSTVYVEGQLEYRKFQDKTGQEKTVAEITVRPFKGTILIPSTDKKGDSFEDSEIPF